MHTHCAPRLQFVGIAMRWGTSGTRVFVVLRTGSGSGWSPSTTIGGRCCCIVLMLMYVGSSYDAVDVFPTQFEETGDSQNWLYASHFVSNNLATELKLIYNNIIVPKAPMNQPERT